MPDLSYNNVYITSDLHPDYNVSVLAIVPDNDRDCPEHDIGMSELGLDFIEGDQNIPGT